MTELDAFAGSASLQLPRPMFPTQKLFMPFEGTAIQIGHETAMVDQIGHEPAMVDPAGVSCQFVNLKTRCQAAPTRRSTGCDFGWLRENREAGEKRRNKNQGLLIVFSPDQSRTPIKSGVEAPLR